MTSKEGAPRLGSPLKSGAPSLATDWEALRRRVEFCLGCGDIEPLLGLGGRVVPLLISALRDSSRTRWERLHAALALGGLGDERAVRPLGEVLRAEIAIPDSQMLVLEAASALERIGTPEARSLLRSMGLHTERNQP